MAGMLDLNALMFSPSAAAAFPPPPAPIDEQEQAELARQAAAKRLQMGMLRAPQPNQAVMGMLQNPAVGYAMQNPGQPDAAAPFGPPPRVIPSSDIDPYMPTSTDGPVPLPRPRPAEADAADDVSARARDPDEIIPPSKAPLGPVAQPSVFERIGNNLNDNSALLLALGAGFAGAPSFAEGMHRAFGLAAPIAQSNQKTRLTQQGINQTVQALRAKGVPEADIAAAVQNPELMKALIAQNYSNKDKFISAPYGKDDNGNTIYVPMNTATGEYLTNKPGQKGQESPRDQAAADGVTGEDYLKTLPTARAARVKAIAEGREPYPAVSRAPDAVAVRNDVRQYDPSFNTADYNSRLKTRQDFTSGKSAQNLSAFNTAIGHLGTLYDAIDGLNNTSQKWWNRIANPVAENTDPKFAAALQKFETARTAVADELTRAFRGSGGNVHDIKQWESNINSASSPEALKAAVRQAAELLDSRIKSVGDQYNRGMNLTKDPLELLSPDKAEQFRHILEGDLPKAKRAAGAGPAAPGGSTIRRTSTGVTWSFP